MNLRFCALPCETKSCKREKVVAASSSLVEAVEANDDAREAEAEAGERVAVKCMTMSL